MTYEQEHFCYISYLNNELSNKKWSYHHQEWKCVNNYFYMEYENPQ